jgi:hypothetical protein
MTSRLLRTIVFPIVLLSLSSIAASACNELAATSIDEEYDFYVTCTNSFSKPNYIVTQYFGGSRHFGVMSLNVGSKGFFCSGDSSKSTCDAMPRGAIPYGTYKSRKSKVTVADIKKTNSAYEEKNVLFRFPKSKRTAESKGCFVLIKESKDVIIGLKKDKLYQSAECLIALERYISTDISLLHR